MSSPSFNPPGPADRAAMPRRRLATALTLLHGLSFILITAASCTAVGLGPDSELGVDLKSRPTDLGDLAATSTCTPASCKGCCQGDVCQPGITTAACGTGGAVCGQCSDAQKCGTDFTCAFDPNATWLVAAAQGSISPTNPASPSMKWRADGSLPRPFVLYDVSNRTAAADIFITGTAPNQVWTATWAAGFTYAAKDLVSTGFDLQVFDQVNMTTTAAMSTKHHVTLTPQDFATKSLTYQGWPGWEGIKSLTIVLQRR